ncbi:MAG: glycosyltransferase [Flavobacteriia bacterium]|jgi:glycosyltransferase involved in cell wall biosynthesis
MALLNMLFTLLVYGKMAFYKERPTLDEISLPPVSVIIVARNEADNLYEKLPFILDQDYPRFEVIVVNHQTTDDSVHILGALCRQYSNLRFIDLEKNHHSKYGKKLPLTVGIKGAKYENMLFTDADCKPTTNQWLRSMASRFIPGKELVLGYAPIHKERGFLNRVIRFDTAWIAVSYFSMALARLPYMGVGRNIAYTKKLFYSVNGFKSHYSLASGDDDLFVQESARGNNYSINIDVNSFCYSKGSYSWLNWIGQKTRHYTTSSRYKVIKKMMLGIYPFSLLMLTVSFVILMFDTDFRWLVLSVYLFITLLKWWIQGRCFGKIKESSFVRFLPLWDLFYALLIPVLYYSSEKKESNRW